MNKPRGVALVPLMAVIGGIVALGLIATVVVLTVTSSNTTNSNTVACTEEAKLCPDGSYVGRTGPKCEFAACPTALTNTNTTTINAANLNANSNNLNANVSPGNANHELTNVRATIPTDPNANANITPGPTTNVNGS